MTLLAARRADEALKELEESTDVLRKIYGPANWETLSAQLNGAMALAHLGRIDDAERQLQPVYDRSPDITNMMWARYVVGVVSAWVAITPRRCAHKRSRSA